ncbi:MAG TPA: twin-arginine translocase TatA/TatE family subunit [bacterium]|nr:twin-arginine translocase TatA/TatE family subunit [bacterium]
MTMISGFGFQEFIVILVLILIVFGPRRLPELMRQLGRFTREFRRIAWEFRSALELESLEKNTGEIDEIYGTGKPGETDDPNPTVPPDPPDLTSREPGGSNE